MPSLLLLRIGAWVLALAGLGGLVWAGVRHLEAKGGAKVQAKWDAQTQADEQAKEARHESQRLASSSAARDYEAQRTAIQAQAIQAKAALREALQRPICPAAGASGGANALSIADLPVPASAVRVLRDAASGGTTAGH